MLPARPLLRTVLLPFLSHTYLSRESALKHANFQLVEPALHIVAFYELYDPEGS